MAGDLRALTAAIVSRHYRALALKSNVLIGENHNRIVPRALSNELRSVFEAR
jgi:hypothetical protein